MKTKLFGALIVFCSFILTVATSSIARAATYSISLTGDSAISYYKGYFGSLDSFKVTNSVQFNPFTLFNGDSLSITINDIPLPTSPPLVSVPPVYSFAYTEFLFWVSGHGTGTFQGSLNVNGPNGVSLNFNSLALNQPLFLLASNPPAPFGSSWTLALLLTSGAPQGSSGLTVDGMVANSRVLPLPSALPLFATGLGALGVLAWWRKRKNARKKMRNSYGRLITEIEIALWSRPRG
jgi:hypothetical protein